jgi:GTP-binding protein EngB required for normal cell division
VEAGVYRSGMNDAARAMAVLGEVVRRHGLAALAPTLAACEGLARTDAPPPPLDVAVLGQFKSGKSSLLNALLGGATGAGSAVLGDGGADLLPVGVLPVTAVVTRLCGGEALRATVTRLDGSVVEVPVSAVAEYVSEAGNPDNIKGVAAVDIHTPALAGEGGLPGLRLVDTPGLGSVHAHNTRSTMDWLPSVALAIVAISVERPLSEEDRRLIETLRPLASRVVIALTKADLVTDAELEQVRGFVAAEIRETLGLPAGAEPVIVPFSVRKGREKHIAALREGVLAPIAQNAGAERAAALKHKLTHLTRAAREYLHVALKAAEKVGMERDALLAAVLDESVKESVIAKELSLAAQSVIDAARPAFEKVLTPHCGAVEARVVASLGEMKTWRGHLGKQAERYREFLRERMIAEMTPLETEAAPVAAKLLEDAQLRFRRIAEAFRDRLSRSVSAALGVTLSPVAWEPPRVRVIAPPVAIGQTFMTHWDLFWWLLPMPVIGGLFRWHCRKKVPWEVWINMHRLIGGAGGWVGATADAIEAVQKQAAAWVHAEIATLKAMLSKCGGAGDEAADVGAVRAAIAELDAVEAA